MIVEAAIGDAYGAGFEFADVEKIRNKNTLTQYEGHPLFPEIKGRYTDDTQMSIAIAELLIEGEDFTPLNIANRFVTAFKRDKRRGYAKRFYAFLEEVGDGGELLRRIYPKSTRNGAAMRAYPLGVLKSEIQILEFAAIQAEVTHQTTEAITAAQTIALSSHYFIYQKGSKSELLPFLEDTLKMKWQTNWKTEVGVNARETVEAVLTVLIRANSLQEMLKKSVAFGGDVDTVASLTLAIGSLSEEVSNDLAQWMYEDLENGDYGHDYLVWLDTELLKLTAISG
ncbi:MAG: ADP-ribosylglycohydrolase family protein [Bacteroidota bacterium]